MKSAELCRRVLQTETVTCQVFENQQVYIWKKNMSEIF